MINRTSGAVEIKFRMTLQYLGTNYSGWQIQPSRPTVQETVSNTLSHLAGYRISVTGAGRTDAGVHALQQVAHFCFPEKDSIPDLKKALNALLPWDIRVTDLVEAPHDFHARKSAVRKRYEYHLFLGEVLPPFLHNRALHLPTGFKKKPAAEAAGELIGTHDFSTFTGAGSPVLNKVRTITKSQFIKKKGELLVYRIEADGFLLHMVRNIVGTLIEVGRGKIDPSLIPSIIGSLDRNQAGPTAPPHGLFLTRIWY